MSLDSSIQNKEDGIPEEKAAEMLSARIGAEALKIMDEKRGQLSRKEFVVKMILEYGNHGTENTSVALILPETQELFNHFEISSEDQKNYLNRGAFMYADHVLGMQYRIYLNSK